MANHNNNNDDDDDGYDCFANCDRTVPSHFPLSQPQFTTRDRFGSMQMQLGGREYVEVKDDGVSGETGLDDFDTRVPWQNYGDWRRGGEGGKGRLSFATRMGSLGNHGGASARQVANRHHENSSNRQVFNSVREDGGYGDEDRFAYSANSLEDSGSDAHLVQSSSPALRASQRRADISPFLEAKNNIELRDHLQHNRLYRDQPVANQYQQIEQPQERSIQEGTGPNTDEHQRMQSASMWVNLPMPHSRTMNSSHALPICQGIQLVPVSTLPDRLRTVFPYPIFNAVQSKCFDTVYGSDDNFVLASPTGSGKTVILELAICRAVATNATAQYKVVYQAPTKALCSERQRDWAAKFTPIGLKCAELTGDSDASDVRNVQSANIIITTPEKWDSITRKWKDHEKLMRLIKVFLIDEVHILKEARGAVLEVIVSRMKSIGTDVRFVALSATVPNFGDVATWLGKSSSKPYVQAPNQMFGEEFRPVKLRRHVCGYASNTSNEYSFEKTLDGKLAEVIAKFSEGKPIMIFCATRASCLGTAKSIARWWKSRPANDRKWNPPSKQIPLHNKDLRDTVASGVAFHHAGLDFDDRSQVEKGFLGHDISVICCTSTLAVGVNLPCHLVIIKNTVTYTGQSLQEYSDLEMMQMLGRAGRPQFDDTAVAVIMTRQTKARRYEMMVTGQDPLESKLHSNLVDHMNAEIGLGTIRDLASARKWLKGTFLYVRLQQNPNHYKLEGSKIGQGNEEQVDEICSRDITLLREHSLISGDDHFRCTDFGHAMARYYVHFDTMKVFMGIQNKATPSEILSAIAQASEFSRLRFQAGEKPLYKLLNKSPSIRFSIPVNLDLPAHKVSLIIQSVLGSADLSWDGEMGKFKSQYTMEAQVVFKHISSLIRCIIDCQISLGDSVSIHSALMLERSFGSRIWDDSPLQMKQIESIGVVGVRKFVNAGIRTLEDLEACEPQRIEALIGRNPPYGMKVLETVKAFPKLRVSLHAQPSSVVKCTDGIKIQVKADIGFINETPPQRFAGKLVYVCMLAETSDGRKIHFARISGQKLGYGQSLVFPALLTGAEQSINCYIMCDSIAGSLRGATVKPKIAPSMFPVLRRFELDDTPQQPNTSKRRAEPIEHLRQRSSTSDDFDDDGIDDEELVKATCGDLDFEHIDNFANPTDAITRKNTAKNKAATKAKSNMKMFNSGVEDDEQEPVQLSNGKWACKHACKDKNACRHLCCKEGMDKPPKKATTSKRAVAEDDNFRSGQSMPSQIPKSTQSKLPLAVSKRKISYTIDELDLTLEERKKKANYAANGPQDYRELHQLHKTVQKRDPPSTLHSVMHTKPAYCYSQGGDHSLSFLQPTGNQHADDISDYGDVQFDELSPYCEVDQSNQQGNHELGAEIDSMNLSGYLDTGPVASRGSDNFGDDDSLLGDAMVGLADSQTLQETKNGNDDTVSLFDDAQSIEFETDNFPGDNEAAMHSLIGQHTRGKSADSLIACAGRQDTTCEPFPDSGQSPHTSRDVPTSAIVMSKISYPESHGESQVGMSSLLNVAHEKTAKDDVEPLGMIEELENNATNADRPIPDGFKDLEPWLFQEFGDIVELVDA